MGVRGADDVWPGDVHGVVDHVRRRVEQTVWPAVDHFAVRVHENQIRGLDQAEGGAQRVHPERVRMDRITQRDVAGDALVETVFAEDAERGCFGDVSLASQMG